MNLKQFLVERGHGVIRIEFFLRELQSKGLTTAFNIYSNTFGGEDTDELADDIGDYLCENTNAIRKSNTSN